MLRVLVTGVVVGWAGLAAAAPTRKVTVESEPPGASVYVNDKEDGAKCTTPCTVDAPIGDTVLIVELENYVQKFQPVVVSKRGKINKVTVKLEPSIGYIVIDSAKGASISVDDVDAAWLPRRSKRPKAATMWSSR